MIPGKVAADFRIPSCRSIRALLDLGRVFSPAEESGPAFPAFSQMFLSSLRTSVASHASAFFFYDRRAVSRFRA